MRSAEPGPAEWEGEGAYQLSLAGTMACPVEPRGVYVIERAPIMAPGMPQRLPDSQQKSKGLKGSRH